MVKSTTLAGLMAAPLLVFALAHARPGGLDSDHLQGWNNHHVDGQGYLQRSRRYSEGCPRRGACGSAGRSSPRSTRQSACAARGRRDEHLRRRHDQHLHREGNVQRSWRRSEGFRRQTGNCRSAGPGSRQNRAARPPRRLRQRRQRPNLSRPATPIRPALRPSARTGLIRSRHTAAGLARVTAEWTPG